MSKQGRDNRRLKWGHICPNVFQKEMRRNFLHCSYNSYTAIVFVLSVSSIFPLFSSRANVRMATSISATENHHVTASSDGKSALIFLGTGCSSMVPNVRCLIQPADPPCSVCFQSMSVPPEKNPNYRWFIVVFSVLNFHLGKWLPIWFDCCVQMGILCVLLPFFFFFLWEEFGGEMGFVMFSVGHLKSRRHLFILGVGVDFFFFPFFLSVL